MKFSNDNMHELVSIQDVIKELKEAEPPLDENPTISEFFAEQEIFITGGSGFIGKVLIEKLLRSLPGLKTIFVLLRPKRGKTVDQRLQDIIDTPLFDVLRAFDSSFAQKLVPIAGDVSQLQLGLSVESAERMRNVSIIYHSAATVKFDDTLKYAVLNNTRGTREVMRFAETLTSLKVVMHVSTAYSNVYNHMVEEKIYEPLTDWEKTIEICEKLSDDDLSIITEHYIDFMPNTYIFSKNLGEQVLLSYKDKLPIILFRPSIVIGSIKEPFSGWVDNFNGPMGILLASTLGISKTMYADAKNVMDLMPVDTCCKSIIIASWKRAYETQTSEIPVYNCTSSGLFKLTIEQLLEIGIHGICRELPMEHMVWQAGGGVTLNKTLNLILLMIYQVIPALFIDMGLKFKGKKPRLMQIQRKMYEANKALGYFTTHNWTFKNENFRKLTSNLRAEDFKSFEYKSDFLYDKILYCRYAIIGYRRYLMNEKDESIPASRRRYLNIEKINIIIKSIPYVAAFYVAVVKFNVVSLALNFLKTFEH